MQFSESSRNVGEHEGQLIPELILSVPVPFDFTVHVIVGVISILSELFVYCFVNSYVVKI